MKPVHMLSTLCSDHVPGLLSLSFPLKFLIHTRNCTDLVEKSHIFRIGSLSPYADGRDLKAGSLEFDKSMHDDFKVEKRLLTDHFTHFRREFNMPQKLMRLLLKHCEIFYVFDRGEGLARS